MSKRLFYIGVLLLLGIGWGSTQALGKIAASTGHGVFGLIFWQGILGVLVMGALILARGQRLPLTGRGLAFAVVIAVVGTVIPTFTFYRSVVHLPAGIMSILISTIPLLSFPIAIALGMDRFSALRLAGLGCGMAGVALIVLPGGGLPDPALAVWVPVALLGPLSYALEGNIVARWGTFGLDPIEVMFWASLAVAGITLPFALGLGQMFNPLPMGRAEGALVFMSVLHAFLYAGYVWLNGKAGAVFAAQVAYFVTGSGVFWAMALLNERFSPSVWVALVIMLAGVALVKPSGKPTEA
ncbi:MAG: EamA family transporter [Rhodobacterales bacterium 32-66-7]|nr:MAG: EamA family transporter [Rhodobacterales bacterium 12-65-15]OYX22866.1 MAG: EamA family transporter [Rhodobacterales bacterium 32-66-7]